MPELDPQSPFTLFLIFVLLLLGSSGGSHVDRHLDYLVNSLQAARSSIAAVRQGFQTFHATLVPPAAPPSAPEPAAASPSPPEPAAAPPA